MTGAVFTLVPSDVNRDCKIVDVLGLGILALSVVAEVDLDLGSSQCKASAAAAAATTAGSDTVLFFLHVRSIGVSLPEIKVSEGRLASERRSRHGLLLLAARCRDDVTSLPPPPPSDVAAS